MRNLNQTTIEKIAKAVDLVVGSNDWVTRDEMIARLNFANIGCSQAQFYLDIALLQELGINGFNHFKRDSGLDKSSAIIFTIFRWFAKNRSRGQAIVHLPEAMNLLTNEQGEYHNGQRCERCNHSTSEPIEVRATQVSDTGNTTIRYYG